MSSLSSSVRGALLSRPVSMSQQLVRRAAAAGVATVIGQALTNGEAEVRLEAAEVADVHRIIARGQLFPPALLAVSAKVASKPFVQDAVIEALRQDYMLVDVPGGAAIPVFTEEREGSEAENKEQEGIQQQHRPAAESKEAEAMQRLSLSASASAPSAFSNLRQRRGKNNQLAPVGSQQSEGEQSGPAAAVADQEAVFGQAERRLRKWGNSWQPAADNQLSSASVLSSSSSAQQSARSAQVDVVTPVDDAADVVTPLPPVEDDSPSAPQAAPKLGMVEWLLQWLESKISGILGVLLPPPSSSAIDSSASASPAVPCRLEAGDVCASSSSPAAPPSSSPASSSSSTAAVMVLRTQMVAGVAAVVIVLTLLRRHSPELFALVAKLLHG